MHVIGTAGHVDHGKSTLIEALTGIHPDRLVEEREREMTIVLGFSWVTLPNGEEIGIVDVPGHRDFIENMLSGIGAIDAALFVVAADEGVMPQTREHLAILDLLQIDCGVVVLTKIDLVDDPDWLELVETDLKETLAGTVLDTAPIVRVSSKSGDGLTNLLNVLGESISNKPPRLDMARPRMSIDRAFTMSGFGTILTGTLIDGHFQVGNEVTILPQELTGRIRGLQTHMRKEQIAIPGSRTAVNVSGVDVVQINRGDVVVYPGHYRSTRRLDVYFRMLPDIAKPLKHNTDVKLFIGAAEVVARLRLLGKDLLKPGEEGWLQLELGTPVVAVRGDRYILRRPSPGETLGGGIILDPLPSGRHKRFDQNIIEGLEALVRGTPEDIFHQTLLSLGVAPKKNVITRSSLEKNVALAAFDILLTEEKILILSGDTDSKNDDSLIVSIEYWKTLTEKAKSEIVTYSELYPLRKGMPREELKSRLNMSPRVFSAAISRWLADGNFEETAVRRNLPGVSAVPVIHLDGYQVIFSDEEQKLVDRLLTQFAADPYSPPSIKAASAEVGEELFKAMVELEYLIPISNDVVFRLEDYERFVGEILIILKSQGTISVAQVRDTFNTSRRYVLAILEHLDAINITVRTGDVRKLKKNAVANFKPDKNT